MSIYAQRLLNVALACRQSPHPELFTMAMHVHACGTPACAFGHYAARGDLQEDFKLLNPVFYGPIVERCEGVCSVHGYKVCYDEAGAHFGLDDAGLEELFGEDGCGNARNAIQAAEYIERFVALMWGIDPAVRKVEAALTDAQPESVLCR